MKIAQLSTPFITLPPANYGGTELVVYNLSEGLIKKGHNVTVYAPGDSKTSARLISGFPKAIHYDKMNKLFSPLAEKLFWMHSLPTMYHAILPFEHADKYDLIHNHIHYIGLQYSSLVNTPSVHTYHGDFSSAINSPIEKMILEKYKNHNWIAISKTQKINCPVKLNFVGIVHHGIPIEKYEYNQSNQNYLAWIGRITPNKGLIEAIKVAKITNHHLIIAGIIRERDKVYFESEVKPLIDEKTIHFVGALNLNKKVHMLKKAKALLYPVKWEEPFGLVMIEAMATGT
ncbi:MAG TPA: glycosyltransferase family 4 protein, partial [Candidatus Nitrosocosmicus sp.]|nr:glycosyltransferase family 4 protein [Candidatus Nitrosocosmicus sp.]